MCMTAAGLRAPFCATIRSSGAFVTLVRPLASSCGSTGICPTGRSDRSIGWRGPGRTGRPRCFGPVQLRQREGAGLRLPQRCLSMLDEEQLSYTSKQIGISKGAGASRHPYLARSFFNISGMSYGAPGDAAVTSLSRGANARGPGCQFGGRTGTLLSGGGCDVAMRIGKAKYDVRDADGTLSEDRLWNIAAHRQVRMFEVKLAQGATSSSCARRWRASPTSAA